MAGKPGTKGNPASKRMSNAALKARRARSWANGQRAKAARVKAQRDRQVANDALRSEGKPTLWDLAKRARAARRAADPRVQKRAAKHAV